MIDAALRVLDRDGLEGLSMRRVGEELGTGAASLYWHVGNKDELLELVLDRVVGELELPEPDPARWQDQLKEMLRRARQVLTAHRDVARITLGRIPVGPNMLGIMEWQLALLRGAGLPDRVVALSGDILGLYLGAYAYEEGLEVASPAEGEAPHDRFVKTIGDYFASLPSDRFPNLVALARSGDLTTGDADDRFEFGLDLLVRGLAAHAPVGRRSSTTSPRREPGRR